MTPFLTTPLGRLRALAFAEGVSFLLILLITMPLKYGLGLPQPNRIFGTLHGVLFVFYVLIVIQMAIAEAWTARKTLLALLASVVPFGTFWADACLFRPVPKLPR